MRRCLHRCYCCCQTSSWSPSRCPTCTCLQKHANQPSVARRGRWGNVTILLVTVADLVRSTIVRRLGAGILLGVAGAVGRRVEVGLHIKSERFERDLGQVFDVRKCRLPPGKVCRGCWTLKSERAASAVGDSSWRAVAMASGVRRSYRWCAGAADIASKELKVF